MISDTVVKAADNLAQNFFWDNKKVIAKSNSPLNQLTNAMNGLTDSTSNANIVGMANSDAGADTHTSREAYILQQTSIILSRILHTAKNVVRPLALEIVEKVSEKRTTQLLNSQNILNNIVYISLPELLQDERFLTLVEDWNANTSGDTSIPELYKALVDISTEELSILSMTGSKTLDDKITTSAKLSFCIFENSACDINTLSISELIGAFLIINGFINERLDSLKYLNDNLTVKKRALEVRNIIGSQLSRVVEKYNGAVKRKEIIVNNILNENINDNNTCFVISKTYQDWIQDGGSIEALIGYASEHLGKVGFYNSDELVKNVEKYTIIYDRKKRTLENINILQDVTQVKSLVQEIVAKYIKTLEDVDHLSLYNKLNEYVDHHYYGGDHLMEYIVKVICRVFDWDDVKVFLLEAENIFKSDENISIERALYLATVKLIGHWLSEQMQVIEVTR